MVNYSDVQGGYPGTGNFSINPVFSSLETYALLDASPCVDAGDPDTFFNDTCFPPSLGTVRNDVGAYGGPGACAWAITPAISIQPESQQSCPGCPVRFSVNAGGEPPLSFQWQFNGVAIPDATQPVLTINNVSSNNVGQYTVVISNAYGTLVSNPASLSLVPTELAIDLYPGLRIRGAVGRTNGIEAAAVGGTANGWTWITNIVQTDEEVFWIDPVPARQPLRLYRIVDNP
jgi:hypothetical protein